MHVPLITQIYSILSLQLKRTYVLVATSVLLHAMYIYPIRIKTHDSESRGQEEAGRTRRTSKLFTRSTALKFVNALNKPP